MADADRILSANMRPGAITLSNVFSGQQQGQGAIQQLQLLLQGKLTQIPVSGVIYGFIPAIGQQGATPVAKSKFAVLLLPFKKSVKDPEQYLQGLAHSFLPPEMVWLGSRPIAQGSQLYVGVIQLAGEGHFLTTHQKDSLLSGFVGGLAKPEGQPHPLLGLLPPGQEMALVFNNKPWQSTPPQKAKPHTPPTAPYLAGNWVFTMQPRLGNVQTKFWFTPAKGSPLHGRPMLKDNLQLTPGNYFSAGGGYAHGSSYIALGLNKDVFLPSITKNKKVKGIGLLAGLFKIPANQMLTCMGNDVYLEMPARSEGKAQLPPLLVATTLARPKAMRRLISKMQVEGVLAGPNEQYLLGGQTFTLNQKQGLFFLGYKQPPKPLSLLPQAGLSAKGCIYGKQLAAIWPQVFPDVLPIQQYLVGKTHLVEFTALNHADGTFSGRVQWHNTISAAEFLAAF